LAGKHFSVFLSPESFVFIALEALLSFLQLFSLNREGITLVFLFNLNGGVNYTVDNQKKDDLGMDLGKVHMEDNIHKEDNRNRSLGHSGAFYLFKLIFRLNSS
jgi:hypothetical protein